jgi:hypothetical protein
MKNKEKEEGSNEHDIRGVKYLPSRLHKVSNGK